MTVDFPFLHFNSANTYFFLLNREAKLLALVPGVLVAGIVQFLSLHLFY